MVNNDLGSGSFGQTVLLKDPFIDELFVAKKYEPYYESDRKEFFDSFLQEIKIMYKLNHRNVVRVFNYYPFESLYTGYILMEYIDGKRINEYLEDPSLWAKGVDPDTIFSQLIDGFACIEERGIVHRDIREGNILITRDGVVKIIDFGLGKTFSPIDTSDDSMADIINRSGLDKLPNEYFKGKYDSQTENFLNEDRGKTFRIALYLLSKTVNEYYLAGPNLSQDRFGDGMRRYLKLNHIQVKEINFEPTLRIAVNAYNSKIEENVPDGLMAPDEMGMVPVNSKVNDKIKDVVTYINGRQYGKTLLYCKSPGKAAEYSIQLSERSESDVFDSYPEGFKEFIAHIQKEYDVNHSIDEWSLIKVLKKGFGIHHGKLPKYIQQEILEQFNKGTFDVLFCTSTIVEGVNTDAQNMIILNASKGRNKLTPFDIKNIKGRAGRYYHCFIGRVFYMTRELERIEMSESFSLDFVTYSDKELGVIDLDNADIQDLTQCNQSRKTSRSHEIDKFIVPREVFIKNRMVSWENQNSLALTLQKDEEFDKYIRWISYPVDVDNFLHYNWIAKILNTFHMAKLIDENTKKKYAAIAHDYHMGGFKEILKYEIGEYRKGKRKTIDDAYARAFNARKDILEHKIPKMLSLFESIIVFVAQSHGISMDGFSLSRVRRYYETGVKTPLGEALMEYGFPVDAIRNLEDKFDQLRNLDLTESKTFCRQHYKEIISVFDSYEIDLFIRAMNSI